MVEQSEVFAVRKLIELSVFPIYHGTKDPDLKPSFSFNNYYNDYGKGFYTTPDKELGKEWAYAAYTKGNQGYLYTYDFDLQGLNVLDLTSKECVVLLTQRKPDMSIEITMTEEDLALTRAEAKATYKEITDYVQNKYGLKVNNLYVAQVKREFGIIERENYNKGKEGHYIPQVTSEKRAAIIDALRFYKMIV